MYVCIYIYIHIHILSAYLHIVGGPAELGASGRPRLPGGGETFNFV